MSLDQATHCTPNWLFYTCKLKDLEKKMKLTGYVPDLEFVLHDAGEELKEQLLLWHSEKLAIAFGLLKVPLGVPIRVFKNLRVCGVCHSATKYISTIEGREITVRDTTRFHHISRMGSAPAGITGKLDNVQSDNTTIELMGMN